MVKLFICIALLYSPLGMAFPGFFISKKPSQPVLSKNNKIFYSKQSNKVSMTILLDYKTTSKDFALVLPISSSINASKIRFLTIKDLQSLESFTSPYLEVVEDSFNCGDGSKSKSKDAPKGKPKIISLSQLKNNTQAEKYNYQVVEIKENGGFRKWLENKKYYISPGLRAELTTSLKGYSNFLVITLKNPSPKVYTYLNPIQVAYETKYLSIPMQIGSINSTDFQRSWVYIITQNARVEVSNYRTENRPTDMILPEFTTSIFDKTYTDLTLNQPKRTSLKSFHLEFTGPIRSCTNCPIPSPSAEELSLLGVQWITPATTKPGKATQSKISPNKFTAYVTRLYANYSTHIFKAPIAFLETKDQTPFQTFFNVIKPSSQLKSCTSPRYIKEIKSRRQLEAQNLASITGWSVKEIDKKIKSSLEKTKN